MQNFIVRDAGGAALPTAAVRLGRRHRRNLGDVRGLADSIDRH